MTLRAPLFALLMLLLLLLGVAGCGTTSMDAQTAQPRPDNTTLIRLNPSNRTFGNSCVSRRGDVYVIQQARDDTELLKLTPTNERAWSRRIAPKARVSSDRLVDCELGLTVATHGTFSSCELPHRRVNPAHLKRIDSSGSIIWEHKVGGDDVGIQVFSVGADRDGNTYFGGRWKRCAPHLISGAWFVRVDPQGHLVDLAPPPQITEIWHVDFLDGDILVAGTSAFGGVIARIDAEGAPRWAYSVRDLALPGGIEALLAHEEGLFACGLDLYGAGGVFVARLTADGRKVWLQRFEGVEVPGFARCLLQGKESGDIFLLSQERRPDRFLLRPVSNDGVGSLYVSFPYNSHDYTMSAHIAGTPEALYIGASPLRASARAYVIRHELHPRDREIRGPHQLDAGEHDPRRGAR